MDNMKRKCPNFAELAVLVSHSKDPAYLEDLLKREPEGDNERGLRLHRNANDAYTFAQQWGVTSQEVGTNLTEHLADCPGCFKKYVRLTVDKATALIKVHPNLKKIAFYSIVREFDYLGFFK